MYCWEHACKLCDSWFTKNQQRKTGGRRTVLFTLWTAMLKFFLQKCQKLQKKEFMLKNREGGADDREDEDRHMSRSLSRREKISSITCLFWSLHFFLQVSIASCVFSPAFNMFSFSSISSYTLLFSCFYLFFNLPPLLLSPFIPFLFFPPVGKHGAVVDAPGGPH